MTMVTIEPDGRLAVPEELREKAGLSPGTQVEIRWQRDHLEIQAPTRKVRLERRGLVTVAVPEEPGPELPQELVDKTLGDVRDRHGLS